MGTPAASIRLRAIYKSKGVYFVVRRANPHKSSIGCDDGVDDLVVGTEHHCHRAWPDRISQKRE